MSSKDSLGSRKRAVLVGLGVLLGQLSLPPSLKAALQAALAVLS